MSTPIIIPSGFTQKEIEVNVDLIYKHQLEAKQYANNLRETIDAGNEDSKKDVLQRRLACLENCLAGNKIEVSDETLKDSLFIKSEVLRIRAEFAQYRPKIIKNTSFILKHKAKALESLTKKIETQIKLISKCDDQNKLTLLRKTLNHFSNEYRELNKFNANYNSLDKEFLELTHRIQAKVRNLIALPAHDPKEILHLDRKPQKMSEKATKYFWAKGNYSYNNENNGRNAGSHRVYQKGVKRRSGHTMSQRKKGYRSMPGNNVIEKLVNFNLDAILHHPHFQIYSEQIKKNSKMQPKLRDKVKILKRIDKNFDEGYFKSKKTFIKRSSIQYLRMTSEILQDLNNKTFVSKATTQKEAVEISPSLTLKLWESFVKRVKSLLCISPLDDTLSHVEKPVSFGAYQSKGTNATEEKATVSKQKSFVLAM